MKTIEKARFDGSVLIPLETLDLPVGTIVEFAVPALAEESSPQKTFLQTLAEELAGFPDDPDWPPDYSEQIDHYLYGTPKR
jgi:hypothetical protein